MIARQLHRERGDAWDENLWRRTINEDARERGWPASVLLEEDIPNPGDFGADPRLARKILMDDPTAKAEAEAERLRMLDAVSEENFRERERAAMRAENEELKRRLDELMNARADGTFMPAGGNVAVRGMDFDGFPPENATMRQHEEWGLKHNLDVPNWKSTNMRKDVLRGLLRRQLEEKKAPPEMLPRATGESLQPMEVAITNDELPD